MGPNRTIYFKMEGYEDFGGWEKMPKGELFKFAVNPYNGLVVMSFQERQENALAVIEGVSKQLSRDIRRLRMQYGKGFSLTDYADMLDGKSDAEIVPLARRVVDMEMCEEARKVS